MLHEGESGLFEEPRFAARANEAMPAVSAQRNLRTLDAAELRRAVIMSEILAKPRALRARGTGR